MNNKYTKELIIQHQNRDEIIKMMNDDNLLTHYVGKLIDCLAQDKLFPPHPRYVKEYEADDILQAQQVLTMIHKSDKKVFKCGLIWLGLRVCPSFVSIFCPPPDPYLQRRFLVNPEKLAHMIKGDKQPLRYELSRFVTSSGRVPIHHFVCACLLHWYTLMPWLDYEVWSNISPNAPSREIETAARRRFLNDGASPDNDNNLVEYNQHANSSAYMLE